METLRFNVDYDAIAVHMLDIGSIKQKSVV